VVLSIITVTEAVMISNQETEAVFYDFVKELKELVEKIN
jgi:hypothetical protein